MKILLSLQRYEEAISYFDKALEIDQFETTILRNNSIAKLTVGDKESSLRLLKQAIDKDPTIREFAKYEKRFERLKDDLHLENLYMVIIKQRYYNNLNEILHGILGLIRQR
ncbi:MAG TPA: tetratricopeptide repeat protein [Nitrososphaeraceae archaeon]|nr:tetratricopeptide repeat protein [Nitrososphaeraceae archaeon]